MTDNEIIKFIEHAINSAKSEDGFKEIYWKKLDYILDIINRQNAEIERLQESGKEAVSCFTRMESLYKIKCKELEVAKSEAIKEFAERLKEKLQWDVEFDNKLVFESDIDNLVKEMTE